MTISTAAIEVDDEGVWRADAAGARFGIRWDEIERVSVSKLDVIEAVETILELDFDNGEFLEVSGSVPGFGGALERICTKLAGARPDWKEAIDRLGVDDAPITLWSRAR